MAAMDRSRWPLLLAGLLVLSTCGPPGGSPHRSGATAGRPITVDVAWNRPLAVEVPGVATISGPSGTLAGSGSATITPVTGSFAAGSGVTAAGTGIDVTFKTAHLMGPLTIVYDTRPAQDPDAQPVVAHRADDGGWELKPATLDGSGRIQLPTQTFSPNIPAWIDPKAWMRALGNSLAALSTSPRWRAFAEEPDEPAAGHRL